MVVAFHAIYFEFFDAGQIHIQACALHAAVGDHKVVCNFSAHHHHRVHTQPAVDANWRVDVVFDVVVAGAAAQLHVGHRQARACQHEGANNKLVVAVFAEEFKRRLVAVNREAVVTIAAKDGGGEADTTRQEAQGGLDGFGFVSCRHMAGVARAAEHLAELEGVGTPAAVQRRDGGVVVGVEGVVAVQAVDEQPAIDALVVVDALDLRGKASARRQRIHQRDKVLADEEDVAAGRAIDRQLIGAVGRRATVVDAHDVVRRTAHVDGVVVGAALAVDADLVTHAGLRRCHARQMADRDAVVASATIDCCVGLQLQVGTRRACQGKVGVQCQHIVTRTSVQIKQLGLDRAPDIDGVVVRLARNAQRVARGQVARDGYDAALRVGVCLAGWCGIARNVALVIALDRDVVRCNDAGASFDGHVIARQNAHRAAGGLDLLARQDHDVVLVAGLVQRHQDDVGARRDVLAHRHRAGRGDRHRATRDDGRRGRSVKRIKRHGASVGNPGAAQGGRALQRAHRGVEAAVGRTNVVGRKQLDAARGHVARTVGAGIENAGSPGHKGGVGGAAHGIDASADLVDQQVAQHFDNEGVLHTGAGEHAARAGEAAVDLNVAARSADTAVLGC